ncbi:MAG: AMP-binding protein [Paludibacteraceae bacterium]|nr:AMP-binding protein [Paludibacteraceae bacterium]
MKHYLASFEETVRNYWDTPALTDIETNITKNYGQFAAEIAKLHLLFKAAGIKEGDKIAIYGRNTSNWVIGYFAISTYKAVVVSILSDFKADAVHNLINHSEAKFLLTGDLVWPALDTKEMPGLLAAICLKDFNVVYAKDTKLESVNIEDLFKQQYPNGFTANDVNYPKDNLDDLALINYTSGTTSAPKGVMLTHHCLSSNVKFAIEHIPNQAGWRVVSMLPMAHMFGLAFDCLYPLTSGCHLYVFTKMPAPQALLKAYSEIKPYMILTVPLVIEKMIKKAVFPTIKKPLMRILWYTPGINILIRKKVHDKLWNILGNTQHLIMGGAPLNHEVEKCLKQIKLCYTVGYGMTECGPLISYCDWHNFKERSCGQIIDRMEVKIDSANPYKEVGEILVRGVQVMQGYYKNEEATRMVITEDGWLRTGDLGIIDKQGNIFIRGRNKNMILGASGQNIYPEEIEGKLNNLPYVAESLVVERAGKLVALVYPNQEELKKDNLTASDDVFNHTRHQLNRLIPAFCHVSSIEIVDKEFEKTPKRSIKRFMYK